MRVDYSDAGRVLLGCLLYAAGSAILYVFPAFLADLGSRAGIDDLQMGSITGAENAGIGLASILSLFWVGRIDPKLAAILAALTCAGLNLLALFLRSFEAQLAARFLTGFFGEGVLFSLAFLVLRSTRNPDRSFGIALTTVVTFGSIVLAATPLLDRVPVSSGALLPLAAVPLTILLAVRWMPARRTASSAEAVSGDGRKGSPAWRAVVGLVAMAVWYSAPGAFWTFAETAALGRQIPAEDISMALAIGNAVGLLGSLATALQGDRWGRAKPILGATVCLCLSVVAFEHSLGVASLSATLAAFNIFWNYGAVYQMGLVVSLDPIGKISLAISAAQVFGFAVGGFVSGLVVSSAGFAALTPIVSSLAVLGLLMFVPCFERTRLRLI